ncbi:MAG: RsmD family RNA methyltransferase [Thermanaerothrix sp.]|nr:RsmD family RNA methyltransferase [Thermanaerothrix sp.]
MRSRRVNGSKPSVDGPARPTSGKVIQALFNILGPLDGLRFLDLFSGSGRVARRASEMGAKVTAVDINGRYCREISGCGWEIRVVKGDVRRFIQRAARDGDSYHVVFADPPYCMGWVGELMDLFSANRSIIKTGGTLILEHSVREPLPEDVVRDDRVYGETVLSFFWRWEGGDGD